MTRIANAVRSLETAPGRLAVVVFIFLIVLCDRLARNIRSGSTSVVPERLVCDRAQIYLSAYGKGQRSNRLYPAV